MNTPSQVHDKLYMGPAPRPDDGYMLHERFDVLVLAAEEHQPSGRFFPHVQVIHAPLDDGPFVPSNERRIALKAAALVATALSNDKRVLVTCWMGLNRSGLITALALVRLGAPAEKAIELVRRARGENALNNDAFVEIILQRGRKHDSGSVSTV